MAILDTDFFSIPLSFLLLKFFKKQSIKEREEKERSMIVNFMSVWLGNGTQIYGQILFWMFFFLFLLFDEINFEIGGL